MEKENVLSLSPHTHTHTHTQTHTDTHTHTHEYSHKMKEILPFVATCMDPDSIMPSEISHTEKDKLCFLKKQTKKLHSYKESRLMVASAQAGG